MKFNKASFLLQILFILLIINAHSAFAQIIIDPSIDREFTKQELVPVLIYLKQQADLNKINDTWTKDQKANYTYTALKECAEKNQKNLVAFFQKNKIKFHSFFIANALRAEINKAQLIALQSFSEIKSITFDISLAISLPTADQSAIHAHTRDAEVTWGIQNIHADQVWDMGYQGQGVVVAGEDTGYKWDLDGIKEKYRGYDSTHVDHAYNWHDAIHKISPLSGDSINPCGLSSLVPCDDNGHGTHTMGTMCGHTSEYLYGVAPKAKWIGCRNMERGNGAPSTYIECFEFFLAPTDLDNKNPKPSLAPHVINNSWYCSVEEGCDPSNFEIMEQVVKNLKASGIVVVVSAGNSGNSCSTIAFPPAMFEASFTVGSYAINDTISNFSSIGPVLIDSSNRVKPNVVAPGSAVLSRVMGGGYEAWNGTSMAGPHAAGLVALIISANPKLAGNVNKIENIIESTARAIDASVECGTHQMTEYPNIMYGYGRINALAAINKTLATVDNHDINSNQDISITPNPASDYVIISSNESIGKIKIINASGKIIHQSIPLKNSLRIDTKLWQPGMYFIYIDNTKTSFKWLKI